MSFWLLFYEYYSNIFITNTIFIKFYSHTILILFSYDNFSYVQFYVLFSLLLYELNIILIIFHWHLSIIFP